MTGRGIHPSLANGFREMQLIRVAYRAHGTFGVLLDEGEPFAVTLERPWNGNLRGVSSIPCDRYLCLRCRVSPDYMADSRKFGDTFQVYEVRGRKRILFHKGNLEDDTHGCILVGEQYERVKGRRGIAASAQGFAEFLAILKDEDRFFLTIRNADPAETRGLL